MCELFGVNSASKIHLNDLLKDFFSHSEHHPHGWGMAVFYENSVSLEKEPLQASKSVYLRERLKHKIEAQDMIAHIRLATVGTLEYENSHPFVKRDNYGRTWTLAHNGTIFDYSKLNPYIWLQEGKTDSERILYYLVDRINQEQAEKQRMLSGEERFLLLDRIICDMAPGNKINLLIYDGEFMYVHTNYADSLYIYQEEGTAIFATVPLLQKKWEPVPFTTLLAYRRGERIFTGTEHGHEYKNNKADMKYLFVDFAQL
ncbi:MAG: class II glutamine amidotransferase [Lachnospiraceae bacterium]|nr:class II glutamine amidotransferase [Lachnospiraceae bacterium]